MSASAGSSPTAICGGTPRPSRRSRSSWRLARLLPRASLEVLDGAGAFVTEDQPQRLAALIGSFLASTAVAAAPA